MMRHRPQIPWWLVEWVLPALCLAGLLLKLLIIGASMDTGPFPSVRARVSATGACILLSAIPMLWVRGKARVWFALIINLAATILALGDVWHVRYYGDLLTVTEAGLIAQLPVVASSVWALMRPQDLYASIDIVLCATLTLLAKVRDEPPRVRRSWRAMLVTLLVAAGVGIPAARLVAQDPEEIFEYQFQRQEVAAAVGLAATTSMTWRPTFGIRFGGRSRSARAASPPRRRSSNTTARGPSRRAWRGSHVVGMSSC